MQLCGNADLWIVSHLLLITFKIELVSFKSSPVLSEAEKEVQTGLHMRSRSTLSIRYPFPISGGPVATFCHHSSFCHRAAMPTRFVTVQRCLHVLSPQLVLSPCSDAYTFCHRAAMPTRFVTVQRCLHVLSPTRW